MQPFLSLEKYLDYSKDYSWVPIWVDFPLDIVTAVQAFARFRSFSSTSYLLESVQPDRSVGRYSFIGVDPLFLFSSNKNEILVEHKNL